MNLLKISENPSYNLFYENFTSYNFMPLITLPTILSDTCDTLIDNIFTNNSDQQHTRCSLKTLCKEKKKIMNLAKTNK